MRVWRTVVVSFVGAALFAGCLTNDDGVDPEDALPLAESEKIIAEGLASMVVGLVAAAVDELPEWSNGEFASDPENAATATWNEGAGEWIVRGLEEYGDSGVNGVADFSLRARFMADGVPVRDASESVDRMTASLLGTNLGIFAAEASRTEFDWAVELDFVVEREADGARTLSGTGGLTGATVTRIHEREYARGQDLGWHFDVRLGERSSCGEGALTGTMGDATLAARFDVDGGADWTVTRAGSVVASGRTTYGCGPADWIW